MGAVVTVSLPVTAPGRLGICCHEAIHSTIGELLGRRTDEIVLSAEVADYLSTDALAVVRFEPVREGDEFSAALGTLSSLVAPARAGCWGTSSDMDRARKTCRLLANATGVDERKTWTAAGRIVDSLLNRPEVLDQIEDLTSQLLLCHKPWINGEELRLGGRS